MNLEQIKYFYIVNIVGYVSLRANCELVFIQISYAILYNWLCFYEMVCCLSEYIDCSFPVCKFHFFKQYNLLY